METKFAMRKYGAGKGTADPATVAITEHTLLVDDEIAIDLETARIEVTGFAKNLVSIHDAKSGITLITEDKSILDELATFDQQRAKKLRKQLSNHGWANKTYWLKASIVVGLVVCGTMMALDHLVDAALERIDLDTESKIGDAFIRRSQYQTDGANFDRVKKVGTRLVSKIPDNKYKFRFMVDDDKDVNAFAGPGGIVVVNRGLLQRVKSDDELAGVMAHEIGHVLHRDSLKGVLHSLGTWTCISIVTGCSGDAARDIENALLIGRFFESQSFSRMQEARADVHAVSISARAGYKPEALIAFFERELTNSLDTKFVGLFSDHPVTSDRIASIKEEIRNFKAHAKPEPAASQVSEKGKPQAQAAAGKTKHSPSPSPKRKPSPNKNRG